jgi:DNA replication protein DnaC
MIHNSPIPRYSRHPLRSFPDDVREVFENFTHHPVDWYEEKKCALLWGPEGTGKSCLLGAVHKRLANQKRLVYWVDCARWPSDYDESRELKETLSSGTTRIVLWDDLGKEPKNIRGDLVDTFFARYAHARGVDMFTTNLALNSDRDLCEMGQMYGPSVRSRLLGMCGDLVIQYLGVDRRMERRA